MDTSDWRSAWPKGWPNFKLTWGSTTCGHYMPLLGDMSEPRSTGPKLVPFLATRCLYCWVHLTEGQPDPNADQMSSWSDVVALLVTNASMEVQSELRSTGPNLDPVLATRCLYWGSIWLKHKKDIWKFEHTWGLEPCFAVVFSIKDQ